MANCEEPDQRLTLKFDVRSLIMRSVNILIGIGVRDDIAKCIADILVEGEMLGHSTHGLNLLAPYVEELLQGKMAGTGEWEVRSSRLAVELWDGRRLPGPWLVKNAIKVAAAKARQCGTGSVSVGGSHHIACLAAYLIEPAEGGLIAMIQSADPAAAGIAPFGGTKAVISPNPIAAGIPARPTPTLLDISTSITTFGLAMRTAANGGRLPGAWLLDGQGVPTDDPAVLSATPPGTLLPLGGQRVAIKALGWGFWWRH